jgi:hypothetical protein
MTAFIRRTSARAALLAGTFALGFLAGSVSTPSAEAQIGDMLKDAAKSGSLGAVGDLGSSIVEMQEHVDGLQKNLDTLREVKSSLGG